MASVLAFLAAAKAWVQLALAAIGLADKVASEIHDSRQRDAGRADAERDQAQAGAKVEGAIATEAAKSVTEDDAIERMKRGEA